MEGTGVFRGVRERFSLTGRVALVAGGSRGIGAAIAEGFAEAGADLALVGRSGSVVMKIRPWPVVHATPRRPGSRW